jgi:hypothetical protein
MFAIVATSVALPHRSGAAKSMSVAVAVPVKIPADRPERTRATSSSARSWANRNATALSAERTSPGSSTHRRPTWSERRPKRSREAITPTAYVAKITVIISSENPNCSRYRAYSGVGRVVPSIATASAKAAALVAKATVRFFWCEATFENMPRGCRADALVSARPAPILPPSPPETVVPASWHERR